jgi:hypothetical protein
VVVFASFPFHFLVDFSSWFVGISS